MTKGNKGTESGESLYRKDVTVNPEMPSGGLTDLGRMRLVVEMVSGFESRALINTSTYRALEFGHLLSPIRTGHDAVVRLI